MSDRRTPRGIVSGTLVVSLLASLLTLAVAPAAQAAGTPDIGLDKTGPSTVLVGEEAEYSLEVSNPTGPGTAYNVSFREILPAGLTYVAGSTSPTSFGEPKVIANKPASGQTTLIWSNLFDINVDGANALTYRLLPNATTFPVGATFLNAATAYASDDPFIVPKFDANGAPIGGGTGTASDVVSTLVTALEITKTEPSPENELVRGIHDNSTVYTMIVTNNKGAATDDIAVADYIPAGLEYLGCGGVDNSTPGSIVEYDGAPRLTAVPPIASPPCRTPSKVSTVSEDPPGPAPAGVYTKVEWPAFDLAPGATRTFTYRAGVPLYANTTDWVGLIPLPVTGRQAANLGNNNGASTAETATELALTNHVRAEGTYQGVDNNGDSPVAVTADGSQTVTAEDLALRKTVSPSTFSIGGTATYTLTARTSEYRATADAAFVDTLPDGVLYVPGTATATLDGVPATVTVGVDASTPSAVKLTFEVNGGVLPTNAVVVITFQAIMQAEYANGAPTAAGDSYVNSVSVSGTTTPAVVPNVPPGPTGADVTPEPDHAVTDDSTATLTSSGLTVDKRIGQNRATHDCPNQTYSDAVPSPPYQIGDIVCFELNARFAAGPDVNNVLSPVIRDFLPNTLAFVGGSESVGPANTLPVGQIAFDDAAAPGTGGGSLVWKLGEPDTAAPNTPDQLVVRPLPGNVAAVFQVRFAAIVVTTVLDQNKDLTGNLMKASAVDSSGQAATARDETQFELAGSQVDMVKGVYKVTRGSTVVQGPFPPNTDHRPVQGGDVVTYRIDVTNTGTSGAGSDVPVRAVVVRDVLPAGVTCAAVSAISDSPYGSCTGSTIQWNLPITDVILADQTRAPLTYDVTVPPQASVNTTYTNTATVLQYQTRTNSGWVTNEPVDVTDVSDVYTANVTIAKTGVTSLDLPNNNLPNQFTVGEEITYNVDVKVPPGTTANSGVVTDTLPANLLYVSSNAQYAASGLVPDLGPLPSGAALTVTSPRTVKLTLPSPFTNSSQTASALFRTTITARVLGSTYTHGESISNSARFQGTTFNRTASYAAKVVIPNPVIDKSNNAPNPVLGGASITYTLTVTNPSPASPGLPRPNSYDTVVTDCVPVGMEFIAYDPPPAGVTTVPEVIDGCGTGSTKLQWNVGSVAAGASVPLTYRADVTAGAPASDTFTNVATVVGSSLDNGVRDPAVEGVYSDTATSSVRTSNGEIDKTVDPGSAPVGDTAEWTITTTYQDSLSFYDAIVVDEIPTGVDASTLAVVSVTCDDGADDVCATLEAQPDWGVPSLSGQTATWPIGDVGLTTDDVVVTITYSARIKSGEGLGAGDVLTNTATSRWSVTDGEPLVDGVDASSDLVVVRPLLEITKGVSTDLPTPGEPYTYQVVVSNDVGDNVSDAYLIEVQDAIPVGVIVDASSISSNGSLSGSTPDGGGTISWVLDGPLAPGGSIVLTYEAMLTPSAKSGTFTNTVDVTSYASFPTNGDTYDDVDPAEATVTVGTPKADLGIVKTPSGSSHPYSTWTFSLAVKNYGPSDAEGPILVVDELPVGMSFESSGPGWACGSFEQTVFCALLPFDPTPKSLAPDEEAPPLLITVSIAGQPETATYVNTAEVSSLTEEPVPDPHSNTSSATVTVTPIPLPPTGGEKPVDPDPEKPVDPDPEKPVDPGKPVKPPLIIQKPDKPLVLPPVIKPGKPTVVLPGGVVTNAGQDVTATVQCRPLTRYIDKVAVALDGSWVPMGQVRYCRVQTKKNGKVIVTTTYPGPVLVKVTYTAPKVPGYTAYVKVKRWVVVPRHASLTLRAPTSPAWWRRRGPAPRWPSASPGPRPADPGGARSA